MIKEIPLSVKLIATVALVVPSVGAGGGCGYDKVQTREVVGAVTDKPSSNSLELGTCPDTDQTRPTYPVAVWTQTTLSSVKEASVQQPQVCKLELGVGTGASNYEASCDGPDASFIKRRQVGDIVVKGYRVGRRDNQPTDCIWESGSRVKNS